MTAPYPVFKATSLPDFQSANATHPQVSFHYTPTHASWVNLIEAFFSILTRQGLQQAVHKSIRELERFLKDYIVQYNKRCSGPAGIYPT